MEERQKASSGFSVWHFIVRIVAGMIVLGITAALTPGFRISGLWALFFGSLVLAGLDYLVLKITGIHTSSFGRGIVGFILSVGIIYLTQYFVSGFSVTLWGALLGALIYAIVDAIIPGETI